MAVYAVGDVQGCSQELEALLKKINLRDNDQLWLAGDLINRGPDSLKVLRKLRGMGAQVKIVLGNHDLHLLAIVFGGHKPGSKDTFSELLRADDVEDLAHWLRQQKLVHIGHGHVMTHAGLPPQWSVKQTQDYALEVEAVISQTESQAEIAQISYREFFAKMYGNHPAKWDETLQGLDRLRCIVNFLTRMRLLDSSGAMDFANKGSSRDAPPGLTPWFVDSRVSQVEETILFGHWASINGETKQANCIALDTGCVWGRTLTAYNLETRTLVSQPALARL